MPTTPRPHAHAHEQALLAQVHARDSLAAAQSALASGMPMPELIGDAARGSGVAFVDGEGISTLFGAFDYHQLAAPSGELRPFVLLLTDIWVLEGMKRLITLVYQLW